MLVVLSMPRGTSLLIARVSVLASLIVSVLPLGK
jgi:hypothetical protein